MASEIGYPVASKISPSVPERLLGKQADANVASEVSLRGGEAGGKVATTSGLSRVVCPSLRGLVWPPVTRM